MEAKKLTHCRRPLRRADYSCAVSHRDHEAALWARIRAGRSQTRCGVVWEQRAAHDGKATSPVAQIGRRQNKFRVQVTLPSRWVDARTRNVTIELYRRSNLREVLKRRPTGVFMLS